MLKPKEKVPLVYALFLESKGRSYTVVDSGYGLNEAFGKAKLYLDKRYPGEFSMNDVQLIMWDIKTPKELLGDYSSALIEGPIEELKKMQIIDLKTPKISEPLSKASVLDLIKKFEEKIDYPKVKSVSFRDILTENKTDTVASTTSPNDLKVEADPKDEKNNLMKKIVQTKDAALLFEKRKLFSKAEYMYLASLIGYPILKSKKTSK